MYYNDRHFPHQPTLYIFNCYFYKKAILLILCIFYKKTFALLQIHKILIYKHKSKSVSRKREMCNFEKY